MRDLDLLLFTDDVADAIRHLARNAILTRRRSLRARHAIVDFIKRSLNAARFLLNLADIRNAICSKPAWFVRVDDIPAPRRRL